MQKSQNPNGPNSFVQNGEMPPTAAVKDRSSVTDTKQAPNKSASHSSTAEMDVTHTHGVTCWCCWALVF